MRQYRLQRILFGVGLALLTLLGVATPAFATNRQATGITQNFEPYRNFNSLCLDTVDYRIIADGITSASPGFCPISGQPTYQITLTFNRPQSEYGTRLVIWSNAGNIFSDFELRVFDLTITYVDPRTLNVLTYTKTDVQIADTIDYLNPVYHNFTDSSGNPIRLYGIRTVTLRNLRASALAGETGEAAFREVQVDTTTDTAAVGMQATKTSRVFDETTGPRYMIPGNDVTYRISVSNLGTSGVDSDGVVTIDALPSTVTFFNGDANGSLTGTNPVVFFDSGSGLAFPMTGVRYATSAPASFADCTYSPAAGYDPVVRYLCIRPSGVFIGKTTTTSPSFAFEFRTRIN